MVRLSVRNFVSLDYIQFLHPWFTVIEGGKWNRCSKTLSGDYNILYQFLIAILTYFPVKDLYLYKMLSMLFDFILAISAGCLVINLLPVSKKLREKYFVFT